MLTTHVEIFMDSIEELKKVIPLHYEELALNKDKVPLEPMWEIYEIRENNGQLIYITLRENGILIGYFIGIIAPGLHYRACLTCHMDIFYVHPKHRHKRGGLILFKAVEKELKRRGVQRIYVGHKTHMPDAGRLYMALGYKKVETNYSKWIGD